MTVMETTEMAEKTDLNGGTKQRRSKITFSVSPILRLNPFPPCPPRLRLLPLTAALALACGPSPITANRIETAIETTFANRLELQVARLKLKPLPAPDFATTAICQKP